MRLRDLVPDFWCGAPLRLRRLYDAGDTGRAPTTNVVYEAAYKGNIGTMEMFKFYQVATPQEKDLMVKHLKLRLYDAAWKLLQQVTGVALK